jgi:hypothetical protein
MNTSTEFIVNDYVTEIIVNNVIDLGNPPQMIRTPSYDDYEEMSLISDGSFPDFQNTQNDQESELIPRQLSFEEEMDLPSPPTLTRIITNAHLPDDESEDENMVLPSQPVLTRTYTNAYFPDDSSEDDESKDDSMDISEPPSIVLIRTYTNDDLPECYQENELHVALSEAESNQKVLKELEDNKQKDQDK